MLKSFDKDKNLRHLFQHHFLLEPDVEMMMLIALIGRKVGWGWGQADTWRRHARKTSKEKKLELIQNSSGTFETRNEGNDGWEKK